VKFLPPNVFVAVLKLGDELDFVVTAVKAGFPVEPLLEALYIDCVAAARPVDVVACFPALLFPALC
jgi:hypothetical protein